MAYKFGVLTMADVDDYTLVGRVGQGVVYEDLLMYLEQRRTDLAAARAVFVSTETELYTENYKLPGGGRLQRRGGQAQSAAVKAGGSWDVGYPLEDFGAQLAWTDVVAAYMTVNEFNRHVNTIEEMDINTYRFEMLKSIFNNGGGAARTFLDAIHGSISIQSLANGDAVLYPPVLGSESEATETHYLETGYASASISDTNNPIVTAVEELAEHFGESTGGDNIVTFINPAQAQVIKALTDFDTVPDSFVRQGDNVSVPQRLPTVPGIVLGRVSGSWIVQWRWIPANYLLTVHLEAEAPLKMRIDPPAVGLGTGLQLVAQDSIHPFEMAHWRHRFGFGVANRLNGVVTELGTGGTYTIPTAYA
jgi:hypothetical protein